MTTRAVPSLTPIAEVQRVFRSDLDVATSKRLIEGCAVPYGRAERVSDDGATFYAEEWQYGVFKRSTEPANTGRVKFNYTHNDDTSLLHWIGRTVSLRESADGLIGCWRVDASPFGDAVLAKVADGQLPGLSIDARIFEQAIRGQTRVRTRAHLRHVALVEAPAFSTALVHAMRERRDAAPRVERMRRTLADLRRASS